MKGRAEQRRLAQKAIEGRRIAAVKADRGNGKANAPAPKETITVPVEPAALARALLRHLNPSGLRRLLEAINKVLAEHSDGQQGTKSGGRSQGQRKGNVLEEE